MFGVLATPICFNLKFQSYSIVYIKEKDVNEPLLYISKVITGHNYAMFIIIIIVIIIIIIININLLLLQLLLILLIYH